MENRYRNLLHHLFFVVKPYFKHAGDAEEMKTTYLVIDTFLLQCALTPSLLDTLDVESIVCGVRGTFGRCSCSSLLAQLFLCLQNWILKLGFLVDVAATHRTQSIHKSESVSCKCSLIHYGCNLNKI